MWTRTKRPMTVLAAALLAACAGADAAPAPRVIAMDVDACDHCHMAVDDARTGMGFDLIAFRDAERARARAAESAGRLAVRQELLGEGVGDGHAH